MHQGGIPGSANPTPRDGRSRLLRHVLHPPPPASQALFQASWLDSHRGLSQLDFLYLSTSHNPPLFPTVKVLDQDACSSPINLIHARMPCEPSVSPTRSKNLFSARKISVASDRVRRQVRSNAVCAWISAFEKSIRVFAETRTSR